MRVPRAAARLAGGVILLQALAGASFAEERQIGAMEDLTLSVAASGWCGERVALVARSEAPATFQQRDKLSRAVGLARMALGFECPQMKSLQIEGRSGAAVSFRGEAAADNEWRLVGAETPQGRAASEAHAGGAAAPAARRTTHERTTHERSARVAARGQMRRDPSKEEPPAQQSTAGSSAPPAWTPGHYPDYCAPAVRSYATLPVLKRDNNYQSPDEPVVNYNRVDSDEPSVMNEVANAVNAFGSMVGYGGAMATAYEKAAKAYWAHLDRNGTSDPALEREYAYWIWRRGRFSQEIAAMRGVYYQTGAGAAKFLADSVGSTFPTPNGVEDLKSAQIYDWNKYSACTLKNAETVDAALEYEIFLDSYPHNLENIPYAKDQIGVASFTVDQKKKLVVAMRQRRKFSNYSPPHSGVGASREKALEAIASVGSGASAALADFLETFGWRRDEAKRRNEPYSLFTVNGGAEYSRSVMRAAGMTNDGRAHLIAGVFMGQDANSFPPGLTVDAYQRWVKGGPAPAGFSAMPVEDAAMCAVERWDEGARYVYAQIPDVVDALAEEKVFLDEYCTTSKAANYRSAANRAASQSKICLGDEAYRAAFWSCLSGKPVEAAKSMIDRRLSFYPVP